MANYVSEGRIFFCYKTSMESYYENGKESCIFQALSAPEAKLKSRAYHRVHPDLDSCSHFLTFFIHYVGIDVRYQGIPHLKNRPGNYCNCVLCLFTFRPSRVWVYFASPSLDVFLNKIALKHWGLPLFRVFTISKICNWCWV